MTRVPFFLIPLMYLAGMAISLAFDWYSYWSAGGDGGFAFVDSLEYASYWPLRAYWRLV